MFLFLEGPPKWLGMTRGVCLHTGREQNPRPRGQGLYIHGTVQLELSAHMTRDPIPHTLWETRGAGSGWGSGQDLGVLSPQILQKQCLFKSLTAQSLAKQMF